MVRQWMSQAFFTDNDTDGYNIFTYIFETSHVASVKMEKTSYFDLSPVNCKSIGFVITEKSFDICEDEEDMVDCTKTELCQHLPFKLSCRNSCEACCKLFET